jgi:hypothetical protein
VNSKNQGRLSRLEKLFQESLAKADIEITFEFAVAKITAERKLGRPLTDEEVTQIKAVAAKQPGDIYERLFHERIRRHEAEQARSATSEAG